MLAESVLQHVSAAGSIVQVNPPDAQPIRIYSSSYISHLRMLYFFGATPRPTVPVTLTVELRASGRVKRTLQSGVQPLSVGSAGLIHGDLTYLESGYYYGAVSNVDVGAFDDITAACSASPLVRRRIVEIEDWDNWRDNAVEIASRLDPSAIDRLTRASQLRILAISALAWMRDNPQALGSVDDLRATQIGEAFRKSVMKYLSAPLLGSGVPTPHPSSASIYGKRFDLLCDSLEYNDEAAALCLDDLAINGESSWVNTNLGHHHFGKKEIESADGYYLQSAAQLIRIGERNSHYNNGVFTWRSHQFSRSLALLPGAAGRVTFSLKGNIASARVVHLLGCDDAYFERYGNMCIYSSVRNGRKDVLVHVHVCNPSEKTIATLTSWAARADVMVRYSYEYREQTSVPYYTTLRFTAGPAVMAHYNLPLVVSDIDMVVDRPWSDTLADIGDADAGYISPDPNGWISEHYPVGGRPWDVAAGTMYFSSGVNGSAFSKYVANYIETILSFPPAEFWYQNWGIDQVALRKGVDVVLAPNNASVRNLRSVRFLRGPRMDAGGKAELAKEPAPEPTEPFDLDA